MSDFIQKIAKIMDFCHSFIVDPKRYNFKTFCLLLGYWLITILFEIENSDILAEDCILIDRQKT